jgi:DNA repair protein RecO (recombination protein O)
VGTPAVLLRGHDYGDTSRILRFYTRNHGLLSVVARGVRGRSGKGGAAVNSFASGELVAYIKPQADLHTMKDFTAARSRAALSLDILRFAGAACLAELVLSHAEQEPHPELFDRVEAELDRVEGVDREQVAPAILSALWRVTSAFGFAPELEACVLCGRPLDDRPLARFDFDAGGVRCESCGAGPVGPRVGPTARRQLRDLLEGRVPEDFGHPKRHLALVSDFMVHHVVSRPLKTLAFLGDRLPEDATTPA